MQAVRIILTIALVLWAGLAFWLLAIALMNQTEISRALTHALVSALCMATWWWRVMR